MIAGQRLDGATAHQKVDRLKEMGARKGVAKNQSSKLFGKGQVNGELFGKSEKNTKLLIFF